MSTLSGMTWPYVPPRNATTYKPTLKLARLQHLILGQSIKWLGIAGSVNVGVNTDSKYVCLKSSLDAMFSLFTYTYASKTTVPVLCVKKLRNHQKQKMRKTNRIRTENRAILVKLSSSARKIYLGAKLQIKNNLSHKRKYVPKLRFLNYIEWFHPHQMV